MIGNQKQLFLIHFAGGNCFSYNFLLPYLKGYEVHQLELPGRGKRTKEALITHLEKGVEDLFQQITLRLNGQAFQIFGHSMGAILGTYLTKKLETVNSFPERLIVSGKAGLDLKREKSIHLLEKEAFIRELQLIGGMPADFFNHPDLIAYFLPIIRADFQLIETYEQTTSLILHTPILALMGKEEEQAEQIDDWKKLTNGTFKATLFEGHHFYIYDHAELLGRMFVLQRM